MVVMNSFVSYNFSRCLLTFRKHIFLRFYLRTMGLKMKNENSYMKSPQQVVEYYIHSGVKKANTPAKILILLGLLGGMFIACGAAASAVVSHAITNYSIAKLLGGIVFPVGLMMIIFLGAELFTSDCLMVMGVMDQQFKVIKMLKVLVIVYIANLVGAIIVSFLVYQSGQYDFGSGLLGAYTIKVALGKVDLPFGTALVSGIMCNIFVCAAALMAAAAKDISGKVWAIFFPIMAFVVSGYEHCIANMYYIPSGIFAMGNDVYVQRAMSEYGYTTDQLSQLTWGNFLLKNAIPVTIGNIIGGMLFVGVVLYFTHGRKIGATKNDM